MSVIAKGPSELIADVTANASSKVFAVPAGHEYELFAIGVSLVTTATAGNRQIVIDFRDATDNLIARIVAGATQAASLTRTYHAAPTLPSAAAFVGNALTMPLPQGLVLPAGFDIRVWDSAAIDAAADDMSVWALGYDRQTN